MAGMTSRASSSKSTKASAGHTNAGTKTNVVKKKGGGGGGAPNPAGGAATVITYTWAINASNVNQAIYTFSQAVVWNGGLATGWRMTNTTTTLTVNTVAPNTPTQVTITWSGPINVANMTNNIPQNDPTFKGTQGQFVQSGKQFAGPQT
jgi:hypothetical protein